MNEVSALLDAYAAGIFPMSDGRDDPTCYFIEPKKRGIIPLDQFNIPRSLKKFMGTCPYRVSVNTAFSDVIAACAETPRTHESTTWINHQIEGWFNKLHTAGYAHSVEVWHEDALIGGLYGLAQGGCFNGESMFSRADNASKIALVHLVERLRYKGFTLLDTQFTNDHLKQFGCITIPQADYMKKLEDALRLHVSFI